MNETFFSVAGPPFSSSLRYFTVLYSKRHQPSEQRINSSAWSRSAVFLHWPRITRIINHRIFNESTQQIHPHWCSAKVCWMICTTHHTTVLIRFSGMRFRKELTSRTRSHFDSKQPRKTTCGGSRYHLDSALCTCSWNCELPISTFSNRKPYQIHNRHPAAEDREGNQLAITHHPKETCKNLACFEIFAHLLQSSRMKNYYRPSNRCGEPTMRGKKPKEWEKKTCFAGFVSDESLGEKFSQVWIKQNEQLQLITHSEQWEFW